MRPRLIVVLCIDADPDRPEYGGARYDCPDKLTWRQLPTLAERLAKLREEMLQEHGLKLRFTWFIRADLQIKTIYGDAGWSLKEFSKVWNDASAAGDDLAWHPHAWRWSDSAKCWYNETADSDYIMESYDVGIDALKKGLGHLPAACRVGINFHNNSSMAKLDELGVKVDLSAHPGLSLYYSRPEVGCPVREGFDWTRSPADPYIPSRNDYQRPSEAGESLSILEIPMTVWRRTPKDLDFWKGLSPLRFLGRPTLVRPAFKGWFIPSIWSPPHRFELGLTQVFSRAQARGTAHYASSMHPDDMANPNYEQVLHNMHYLIRAAQTNNMELDFLTASQAFGEFTTNA